MESANIVFLSLISFRIQIIYTCTTCIDNIVSVPYINSENLDVKSFYFSLESSVVKKNGKICPCGFPIEWCLYNIPETCLIKLPGNFEIKADFFEKKLDFSQMLPCNILPNVYNYMLGGLLYSQKDGSFTSVVKVGQKYLLDLKSVSKECAYSFINKNVGQSQSFIFLHKYSSSFSVQIEEVNIHHVIDSSHGILQFYQGNMKKSDIESAVLVTRLVDKADLIKVLSNNIWIKSDIVDLYMYLIAQMFPKVLVITSGWFNQHLFWNSNLNKPRPIYALQGKKHWFNHHYVIIPTNIKDEHWVVFVVDIVKCVIYVCDSLKGYDYTTAVVQLMSYLSLESFIRNKNHKLTWSDWNMAQYNMLDDFQFQKDGVSCGVYVCLMVKALLSKKTFQFDQKHARNTLVYELINNVLV